jgi:hypothetical protein
MFTKTISVLQQFIRKMAAIILLIGVNWKNEKSLVMRCKACDTWYDSLDFRETCCPQCRMIALDIVEIVDSDTIDSDFDFEELKDDNYNSKA